MLSLRVDGAEVSFPDDGSSLLDVLRVHAGVRTAKDGCSPQGQCGCCTVWVDGAPRVACVTPARRVAGRAICTLGGLEPDHRARWVGAFEACGASQCGFCTPGIIMRLAALAGRRSSPGDDDVTRALAAHLCRCTGWQTIVEAARVVHGGSAPHGGARHPDAAARRASLEGGVPQRVGGDVVCGGGGFAEDTAPLDALVAVPDGRGEWVVAETLAAARARAAPVPGRNSTAAIRHPVALPPGNWELTLQTSFVEPAYLEPDASWCVPGGEPASPLANGGAFGGKHTSAVAEVARRLADEYGRAVRVVLSRDEVARRGHKRPPIAAGVHADGSGVVRVARTPGSVGLDRWAAAVHAVAPGIEIEEVAVPGPPVSADLRAAGWAEAIVLTRALEARAHGAIGRGQAVVVTSPDGGRASVDVGDSGAVSVSVAAGEVLDAIVLRSYVIGAVHQALGWVRSEGMAVDTDGTVLDLTVRSFGIIPARAMPVVHVTIEDEPGPAVAVGDSVFAAVATAAWLEAGLAPAWPIERGR